MHNPLTNLKVLSTNVIGDSGTAAKRNFLSYFWHVAPNGNFVPFSR